MDSETQFTRTGSLTIESGLDQEGDLAWRSSHEGMNPLEAVGACVIVGTRMVFRMVLPGLQQEDH